MVELLAGQPEKDGEPVFEEPWQARTFAMAAELHRSGLFTWEEWAATLAASIREQEQESPIETQADYYRAWQGALEKILESKLPETGS